MTVMVRSKKSENRVMRNTRTTPMQQRFSDLDPFNHVNDVSQQMYFATGKLEFFNKTLGEGVLFGRVRIITAATSTSYIGQVRIGEVLHGTTACEKVGNKSLTRLQRIVSGQTTLTESRSVMVAFDFESQQSIPVSDAWRSALLG